jgi:hypothetical protein
MHLLAAPQSPPPRELQALQATREWRAQAISLDPRSSEFSLWNSDLPVVFIGSWRGDVAKNLSGAVHPANPFHPVDLLGCGRDFGYRLP